MISAAASELITIAICTYARHDLLKDAVAASLGQNLDRSLFKVLIVDNSSDRKAAENFYEEVRFDPCVIVEWSSPPGLSRARNRALELCDTPFIAFLDDDAIPDRGWLSAVLSGFQQEVGVAVVGGPIAPLWKGPQPSWMPDRHLNMYGVFRPFETDCDLSAKEYLYGGNIAFDAASLKEVGGFPEEIGRIGTHGLLSNEEYRPQEALRKKGLRIRYVVAARIRHLMHQEKLRRGWMRSRLAWQSVSDQLQDPASFNREYAISELTRLTRATPDVAAAARLFFGPASGEDFGLQLDLIWHFFSLLLSEHRLGDIDLETIAGKIATPRLVESDAIDSTSSLVSCSYAPSASGAAGSPYLFVEGLPGHANLYDVYGDLPGAQLLTYWFGEPENSIFEQDLTYISRSIGRGTKSLFFVTLDQPVYYRPHREAFFRFLHACPVPVYGIIHVMPHLPEHIAAVQRLDELAAGICFLSETMTEHVRATLKLNNAIYLPLHPSTITAFPSALEARDTTRANIEVLPHQTVFSVIGEARHGKGINLLLRSLDYIPREARNQMFFLFAGKATHHDPSEVRAALLSSQTAGIVDLRDNSQEYQHIVLTDRQYAQYVAASDVCLALYHNEQRHRMSGGLPDFVWANCIALATADSYVGAEVERHGLGVLLRSEDPESVARALVDTLQLAQQGHSKSQSFLKYRSEIAPDAVLSRLRSIVDAASAG